VEIPVIIGGAGYAGAASARILAEKGRRVIVLEKESFIGGHSRDSYDDSGVLIHDFGPHIFHTSHDDVREFLSRFTEWRPYEHKVKGEIDGQLVPIPFNLTTLEKLVDQPQAIDIKEKLLERFGMEMKVPILELRQDEDPELRWLGDFVYEKVFLHYTMKMWDQRPEDIDPSVTARVPVFVSKDDRYFQDPFQAMPVDGYTAMFKRMLDHPNIDVVLDINFKDVVVFEPDGRCRAFGKIFKGELIYTGPLDHLFRYCYGDLPYRSLRLEFKTVSQDRFQDAAVVNYPDNRPYTRISEFKQMTGQHIPGISTILTEYPQAYDRKVTGMDTPYYPLFTNGGKAAYAAYRRLADSVPNLTLLGRLAEFRYYNMDAVVNRVMETFADIE
jgi:UDP-galactopyranose mutase